MVRCEEQHHCLVTELCDTGALMLVKQVPGTLYGADFLQPGSSESVPYAAAHTSALPFRGFALLRTHVGRYGTLTGCLVRPLRIPHAHCPDSPPSSPKDRLPYLKNCSIRFSCHKKQNICFLILATDEHTHWSYGAHSIVGEQIARTFSSSTFDSTAIKLHFP